MWSSVSDFVFLRFILMAYLGTLFLFMGMSACKKLRVILWSLVEDSYIYVCESENVSHSAVSDSL